MGKASRQGGECLLAPPGNDTTWGVGQEHGRERAQPRRVATGPAFAFLDGVPETRPGSMRPPAGPGARIDYSALSASSGSVREARHAGTQEATPAVSRSTSAELTSAAGSVGATP